MLLAPRSQVQAHYLCDFILKAASRNDNGLAIGKRCQSCWELPHTQCVFSIRFARSRIPQTHCTVAGGSDDGHTIGKKSRTEGEDLPGGVRVNDLDRLAGIWIPDMHQS